MTASSSLKKKRTGKKAIVQLVEQCRGGEQAHLLLVLSDEEQPA